MTNSDLSLPCRDKELTVESVQLTVKVSAAPTIFIISAENTTTINCPLSTVNFGRQTDMMFGQFSIPAATSLSRQHFLYFLPLPQGQGSLGPTLAALRTGCCLTVLSEVPEVEISFATF